MTDRDLTRAIETPDDHVERYYAEFYEEVHGQGCMGVAHGLTHRQLESGREGRSFPTTLELGCGQLEHYPFVKHARSRYLATDIRRPGPDLVGKMPEDLEFIQADAYRLPLATRSVDRVVAGCLLIHLSDPWAAVVEWQRVCKPEGVIDFLVPCDPGFVSRGFRMVFSQRSARRRGVPPEEYRLVNAIEHVSAFSRVVTLTRAAVQPDRKLRIRYFPLRPIPSWNLNAFAILSIEAQADMSRLSQHRVAGRP